MMLRSTIAIKKVLRGDGNAVQQRLEKCMVSKLRRSYLPSLQQSAHSFSSSSSSSSPKLSSDETETGDGTDSDESAKKQPFVTAHLEPGEWDHRRRDPYFRPKPHMRSKLISAEDFANREPVAFEGEFESYSDGMISLSWLDEKTCRRIYQQYVDMMILSQKKHNTTSHEYVCRVIAQKYNITTARAAGVVQLQHAEEQMRRHRPELLCEAEAKVAEERILQNIRDAYRAEEKSEPPQEYIEDPAGIHGMGEPDEASLNYTRVDDLFDMDDKLEQANVRDAKNARLIIDGHIYKEDVDESTILVNADSATKRLLKAQQKQQQEKEEGTSDDDTNSTTTASTSTTKIPYPETNAKGEKRPRWKYVAKVVNTRDLKNNKSGQRTGGRGRSRGARTKSYTNNNIDNTLVEEDGELRIATISEAKQTAWKPPRKNSIEYIFEGAKNDWLQKTLYGKTDTWGRMPITRASDATATATAAATTTKTDDDKENEEQLKVEGEEETSSSSSSDEEDDTSSSSSDEEDDLEEKEEADVDEDEDDEKK